MKQSNHSKHLIVVGGPTASGKTAFAIRLARHFGAAILSADSRQFYREMNIGTAKPSEEELEQAPHYFVNSRSISEEYSVGDFERDALQILEELFARQDIAVLVGGSGLYIKALCEGLDDFPDVPPAIRDQVEEEYRAKGLKHLQEELARADPDFYEEVDRQNPHRLIRAIAVCRASGQPFSRFRKAARRPRPFTPIYLQLHWPRRELYRRINRRVEQMVAAGLLEEARSLYPERQLTALQTVGYQELFDHFDGSLSRKEAIALIQRNSRRYAKRQLTWYRRDGHWLLLRPDDLALALEYVKAVREEGVSLQYHKEHLAAPARSHEAMEVRMLKNSEIFAAINYSESKREALLEGPFMKQPDIWAGRLLLYQGALLADERKVFAFTALEDELLDELFAVAEPGPEELPDWIASRREVFTEKHPGGRVVGLAWK
ncbi:MAG: tRNA (adenosine(37)-N6)-dimethylallyltransferase MiaA [Phaeodactylibacter sp.]|nr:tRNA (adenosine(37)-N6)-dimethylallyltransferase MiaA [Phaeodactylibacter sp.]